MIRLTFNTDKKTAEVLVEGIYKKYEGILTVKVEPAYYELIQESPDTPPYSRRPILRLPISNTIMFIEK